jgi:hypothetical protein
MSNQREALSLSPIHLKDLANRLHQTVELKDHVKATTDTFLKYASAGVELCDAMANLARSFRTFPKFNSDPTFQHVSQLLFDLVEVFGRHYGTIEESIVGPLLDFLAKDVKRAEEGAKRAAHDYEVYIRALEQYVQPNANPKKPVIHTPDMIGRLQHSYLAAAKADFEYASALEIVERKKLYEIATGVSFMSGFAPFFVCPETNCGLDPLSVRLTRSLSRLSIWPA